VVLSHDPKLDDPALIAALRSGAFYVGALGSRKNHGKRCQRLKDQGLSDSEIARIHGPIGLDIGAKSPGEIAVSIVAQVVAARRAPATGLATPDIAAIVLAGGRSTRAGSANKLLADIDGRPMVAAIVAQAVASRASPVVVVTGHQAETVANALADMPVLLVHNPDFADGLSTSLQAGLAALDPSIEGAVVCLADMPRVTDEHIGRLIDAFDGEAADSICVPTYRGKRGNPVLWARRFFPEIMKIRGDAGARRLIGEHSADVLEVPMEDDGILFDVDTAGALDQARGKDK